MKRVLCIVCVLLLTGCSEKSVVDYEILSGRVTEIADHQLTIETSDEAVVVYLPKADENLMTIGLDDEVVIGYSGETRTSDQRELEGELVLEVTEHLTGMVVENQSKMVIDLTEGETLVIESEDITFEEDLEVTVGDTVKVDLTKIRNAKKEVSALIRESGKTGSLLDSREVVSGLIGQWPNVILEDDGSVQVDQVFAFAVKPIEGIVYKVNLEDFHFEMTGAGAGGIYQYFGFRTLESGRFKLVFDLYEGSLLKNQLIYDIEVK